MAEEPASGNGHAPGDNRAASARTGCAPAVYAAWRRRGVQHRALQRFTRKLTVGAGQTQGQGFVFQQAVDIECVAPGISQVSCKPEGAAFYPRMVITFRRIVTQHPAPVAKTGKGHICLTAGVSRRNNIIDGVNFRMPVLNTHGAQQVFIFPAEKDAVDRLPAGTG